MVHVNSDLLLCVVPPHAANVIGLLVHRDAVPLAHQLLGGNQARGPRADDCLRGGSASGQHASLLLCGSTASK